MASPRPFTVDTTLTSVALLWANQPSTLIADRVLPRFPVGGEKFQWFEYNQAEMFTVPNTNVGRKGRVNQVEFGGQPRTGNVEDYALDDVVPQTDIDEAARMREQGLGVYDPEAQAVRGLTNLIQLDREIRVAGMVFNAANYNAARQITLSGTSQFSDYTNSDPIGVIQTGLDSTIAMRPNTMVIGRQAWTKYRSHPSIVNSIKGGTLSKGVTSAEEVANLFDLRQVLIGDALLNTAKKGQTATYSRAWGKHIALIYLEPNIGDVSPGLSFGFTAAYGDKRAGRYFDPTIGIDGADVLRTGERVKEIIAAQDVGYFIQNAIA